MDISANDVSAKVSSIKRIGILGGTFDPVHNAHLACAHAVRDTFELDKVKFIPCAVTPHRDQPSRTAKQRCDMVKLAIEGQTAFELDTRECLRDGPSYTVETLRSLRADMGEASPLIFILGSDAFQKIESWHEFSSLLDLCHLVVVQRPGQHDECSSSLKNMIEAHQSHNKDDLCKHPAGFIYFLEGPMLDISATQIRSYFDLNMPNAGANIRALSQEIPEAVKHYIHQHGLYQERQY